MRMDTLSSLVMNCMVEAQCIEDEINNADKYEVHRLRVRTFKNLCKTNQNRQIINEVVGLLNLKEISDYGYDYYENEIADDCKWANDREGTMKSNIKIVLEYIGRQCNHQNDKLREIDNLYPENRKKGEK